MIEDIEQLEAAQASVESEYDMQSAEPVEHRFDRIVGNQLLCSLHATCVAIFVKPTEVLERNQEGELVLVDKMPA